MKYLLQVTITETDEDAVIALATTNKVIKINS